MGITLIKDNSALHLQAPGGTTIRNVEEIYVGDSAPTTDGYKVWVKPDEAETTQLASKSYVDEAISNVEGGNVDLTDYYTKQEVEKVIDDAIDTIELLEGPPGQPGEDGYTPIKGVDYFDGKDGEPGAPGKDGADGKDYILTAADKQEIANLVSSSFVDGEGVEY